MALGAEQRHSGRRVCSPGCAGRCRRWRQRCRASVLLTAFSRLLQPGARLLSTWKKSQDLQLRNGIWGSAVLVELLLHRSCRPVRAAFPGAAGSALHGLAASLVLMFSFTRMSALFLPFKAWHLGGPSGYSPGNVGIARTFCTISFKQKQTSKIFGGFKQDYFKFFTVFSLKFFPCFSICGTFDVYS